MDTDEIRWRAATKRAEVLLRRPPHLGVAGDTRDAVDALRREAASDLRALDEELGAVLARRRALVARVAAADRALHGVWRADKRRRRAIRPAPLTRAPEMSSAHPDDLERLVGPALRDELLDLLAAARGPVAVHELVAMLTGSGVLVAGRPSQTIANALAVEVRRGAVVRVRRGVYALAGIDLAS
jgi:hypothetical protein